MLAHIIESLLSHLITLVIAALFFWAVWTSLRILVSGYGQNRNAGGNHRESFLDYPKVEWVGATTKKVQMYNIITGKPQTFYYSE